MLAFLAGSSVLSPWVSLGALRCRGSEKGRAHEFGGHWNVECSLPNLCYGEPKKTAIVLFKGALPEELFDGRGASTRCPSGSDQRW
jgi:hypothetical protein